MKLVRSSLAVDFQPIEHSPLPQAISLIAQVGENWPRKHISQLAHFNLFENKESKFRCTVTVSRISSRKQWWYTGCLQCHRVAKPAWSAYADPRTYTCTDRFCPSTAANVVYCLFVIASGQTGEAEAEFTLFGGLAEQIIGCHIHRLIANNQPTQDPILNIDVAARRVRFPPPEVSKIISARYRFVVSVTTGSFMKPLPSFMVRKVEAAFPRVRRLSSLDTVIPATSWDINTPAVHSGPTANELPVPHVWPSIPSTSADLST